MDYSITPEREKIYSFKKEFSPLHASAIMLGYDPIFLESVRFSNSPEYETVMLLRDVLSELAFNGTFKNYQTDIAYGINHSEEYISTISVEDLKEWALSNGYKWLLVNKTLLQNTTNQDQIAELQARIAELEAENQNLKKAEPQPTTENKTQRISQPQRDIFTLLVVKNYPNCQSRNRLFEAINADLRANGITTKDIKYSTLDKLIDENIRTGSPIRSPFPPKQS